MGLYDTVKYKRNFLEQVLVKIDFSQYIDSQHIFCDEIESIISKFFPLKGKKEIIRFNSVNIIVNNLNADIKDTKRESVEGLLREYFTQNQKNKLVLTNRFIAFEVKEYTSFEEIRGWVDKILGNAFFKVPQLSVERTGIRYVNLFKSEQIRLRKRYFTGEVSSILATKFPITSSVFPQIRSMNLKEYRNGGKTLNFRYGMYNPDYPNELKKNNFILDFDCYSVDIMENNNDIVQFLNLGHDEIQSVFEKSITDALRGELNHA